MSRPPFATTDTRHDDEPQAGVFVLDADDLRRRSVVSLLAVHADLRVLGDHAGSAGAVSAVVRALPHVCVVGPRILSGPVPGLVAEIEHALPATRCVRVPSVLGVDPATLSPTQQQRQITDVVAFVRSVLVAARRPPADPEPAVRAHLAQARPFRPRTATAEVVVSAMTTGWPITSW